MSFDWPSSEAVVASAAGLGKNEVGSAAALEVLAASKVPELEDKTSDLDQVENFADLESHHYFHYYMVPNRAI